MTGFVDIVDLSDLCERPLEVIAIPGAVVLTGPEPVALAPTIAAAEASVRRLQEAIHQAGLADVPHAERDGQAGLGTQGR